VVACPSIVGMRLRKRDPGCREGMRVNVIPRDKDTV
jgi:hypothetical protein